MKKKNTVRTEFIHYVIDGHFYFCDRNSEFSYYVHCDLYDYPPHIASTRHLFRVEGIPEKDDHEFSLIISQGTDTEFAWIEVFRARLWFKMEGHKIFNSLIY